MRQGVAVAFDSGPLDHHLGCHQVLQGVADRLEQGDLLATAAPGAGAPAELEQVGQDVGLGDHAAPKRVGDIAALGQRAVAAVDEDARPSDRRVVGFAHARQIGADQVQMRARLQPIA